MKKRILVVCLMAALIITSLTFTPFAEELNLDEVDLLDTEYDFNGDSSNDDNDVPMLIDEGDTLSVAEEDLLVTSTEDLLVDTEESEEEEEYVPDEPENVVDEDDDGYYEPEIRYYDDEPFDASYITGEGTDRIKKVIIAYAQSLGGTFRSPYYKGGNAVAIQCCAYVNQVWKHVFGKDIYDSGIMTTNSHEGETIYNFLTRTGARAGDILYVRYWKVGKNKWSSHFMILLGYDETG